MTDQGLEALARRLARTTDPKALFGDDPARQRAAYHRLARATHPDLHPDAAELAERAFARLSTLWALRSATAPEPPAVVLSTSRRTYRLGPVVRTDDVAVTRTATWTGHGGGAGAAQVRLPRSVRDDDLMTAEASALRTLAGSALPLQAFVPTLLETFRCQDPATGQQRHVTALVAPGSAVTAGSGDGWRDLACVAADFPGGLDPRDVVWMWRRALLAVGFAHRSGLVHGAVVPANVLVEPVQHGLVLTGWTSSVRLGEPLRAVPAAYRDWYPAEVTARAGATAEIDVVLLTRTMSELMGERAPAALRAFTRGCTTPSGRARPSDAWRLLDELTELVERLYGPRRFRPFPAPTPA